MKTNYISILLSIFCITLSVIIYQKNKVIEHDNILISAYNDYLNNAELVIEQFETKYSSDSIEIYGKYLETLESIEMLNYINKLINR